MSLTTSKQSINQASMAS